MKFNFFILLLVCLLFSCKKEKVTPFKSTTKTPTVTFTFDEKANGMSDFMNGMIMFQNAAGNHFGVTNLKYVLSDFVLYKSDGTTYTINNYHYIDIHDPSTKSFTPSQKITPGDYTKIEMVFGLTSSENTSFSHADLNTLNWNWPAMMGGGYHFMQLEGNYVNNSNDTISYQTHLGATINPANSSDTVNNEIHITMLKNFNVPQNSSNVTINILMNIDEWYKNPTTIDLNQYGAAIMGNYDAQLFFHDNGSDVFSIENVTTN